MIGNKGISSSDISCTDTFSDLLFWCELQGTLTSLHLIPYLPKCKMRIFCKFVIRKMGRLPYICTCTAQVSFLKIEDCEGVHLIFG